jgi:hypothetical protein
MGLDLCNIMSNVVNEVDLDFLVKRFSKCDSDKMRNNLAIAPREVCSGAHRSEIPTSNIAAKWYCRELRIRKFKIRNALDFADVIFRDLISKTTRSGVDHNDNLLSAKPHRGCGALVENFVHNLDFNEMIAGSKSPELVGAPLNRALGDARYIRLRCASSLFAVVNVCRDGIASSKRPFRALRNHVRHLGPRKEVFPFPANSHWDVTIQRLN